MESTLNFMNLIGIESGCSLVGFYKNNPQVSILEPSYGVHLDVYQLWVKVGRKVLSLN